MLFKGSGVALVTPFNGDEINYDCLARLIEWQIKEGTDAIIVCGTTGEAATLSKVEQKKIIHFTVERVKKRIPVIAGVGSNCTSKTIEMGRFAKEVGADGLLVVTPYYNKPTQKGLFEHFKMVAEQVDIPLIIYNVPSRTGVNILPETVGALSKIKNIVGIKEASGDITQVITLAYLCPKDFMIYAGNDDYIVPVLSVGGVGVISVLANLMPRVVHQMVDNYLKENVEEAKKEQLRLSPLIKALFLETNPVPIKEALNLYGIEVGGVRLPLTEMSEKNKQFLICEMKKVGLIND